MGTRPPRNVKRARAEANPIVRFPPLPPAPEPPVLPDDPRQTRAGRVVGALAGIAQQHMRLSGPNLTTGFHASAVDLGALQHALERGLSRFDPAQIESRWSEVFDWIRRVMSTWVQRYKELRIERRNEGIRIEFQTQDDLGYYDYAFDVFPHRDR